MNFLDCFDCICPDELILISTSIAIAITKELDINQANSLGNFFQALGQNIETMAAQKNLNNNNCNDKL